MIKNLFTKRDHRLVPGITKEQAMQAASWFWRSRQFGVAFTSPFSMSGGQFYSKLGLRQSIYVYAVDEGPSVGVDISLSAELTDQGAVVGIVGAVLLFPVAVVVGAVSYLDYENEAARLLNDFWGYLNTFPKNPQPPAPAPLPAWAQGQTAQPVAGAAPAAASPAVPTEPQRRTCPTCGIFLDHDSKFCKSCGTKL
jgi:hypothetical protein